MVRTILEIEGMRCGMCESHINNVIRKNFSLKKVASNHRKNLTIIESEEPLDEEKLKQVIAETGYTLHGISSETYQKKRFALFGRKR